MKSTFYPISETDGNTDNPTFLRNEEIMAANGEPVMELKPNRFVVEIESINGTKVWEFTSETIHSGLGKFLKKVTRVVKAVSTGGLSETKAGKKAEAKIKETAPTVAKTILTGGLGTKEGRAVLSGGLSTKEGRKVISAISTGGLSLTKAGKKLSEKVEKVAEKVDKKVEKIDEKADALAKKAAQKFKTLTLALPRAAFASLAAINIFGIASHLQSVRDAADRGSVPHASKWKKTRDFWYKIGGSRTKFDKLIKKGSKRKPFLAKVKKKSSADGTEETIYLFPGDQSSFNVAGIDDAAIVAWIGIATSVIVAVKQIAGKPPEMDDESAGALDAEAALEAEEFQALMEKEAQNKTPEALRDLEMVMPIWAWVLVGVGVIGAGILTVVAIKKARK